MKTTMTTVTTVTTTTTMTMTAMTTVTTTMTMTMTTDFKRFVCFHDFLGSMEAARAANLITVWKLL